ncbi:MAG: dual specificity protein phosphatase family protein [Dehalococcoidia bacterium]|nr:dual specificity protein phosphatase family protein [Dehalococcoidia bacterium]
MTTEPPSMTAEQEARRAARAAARKRIDRINEWMRIGGALPVDEYERLSEAGVTHVVDLREPHEDDTDVVRLAALGIARRQVPVVDNLAPTNEQLTELASWLTAEASGSQEVYVHCGGGFGRAGTMAMGLLIQRGRTLEEAEREVLTARPEITINEVQRAWLVGLAGSA